MQKDLKEGLASELKPIRERMKNLPKAITFPQFPSITANSNDNEEEGDAIVGDIAQQYLRKLLLCMALIWPLDCEISRVSFTLGIRKQNQGKQYNCWW